ncbi:MAG: type II secretion system protein GspG [Gimesia chilikensis]|uniref:type II secretion system protein GspG n=1 Tax=Gimesia chilikensis TaxID=2605989 RepID=UPI0037A5A96D
MKAFSKVEWAVCVITVLILIYTFLPDVDELSQEQTITKIRLEGVCREIIAYEAANSQYPDPETWCLQVTLLSLGGVDILKYDNRGFLENYYDAWNQPFVYQRKEDGTVTLYSTGLNQIDEQGAGDDIAFLIRAGKIERIRQKQQ